MKNLQIIFSALVFMVLTACQHAPIKTKTRETAQPVTSTMNAAKENPSQSNTVVMDTTPEQPKEAQAPLAVPKVGIILGPGTFKTYAHIGVLQELHKAKIPIQSVVGMEWGALVGALYAHKGQVFDLEWQMFKIKEDDVLAKGLISSALKSRSVTDLIPFLKTSFAQDRIEDSKLTFACPILDLERQTTLWIQRGAYQSNLLNCLISPPLWRMNKDYLANLTDLKGAADYLRSKGANIVIFVNVLGPRPSASDAGLEGSDRITWSLVSDSLLKQYSSVDFVISVNTQDYAIMNVKSRREIMQKGIEAGQKAAQQISEKFGL